MGEVGFTISLFQLIVMIVGITVTIGIASTKVIFALLDKRITKLEYKLQSPPLADKLAALRLSAQYHDNKILERLGGIEKSLKAKNDVVR